MPDTIVSRLFRLAVAPALVAGGLALAQPALAADYCVGGPNDPCSGTKVGDLQTALDAAAIDSVPDRIFLGAGTYNAPAQGFVYDPLGGGGPVEIAGAGQGETILNGASGAYRTLAVFGGSATSIHNLRVLMPPNAPSGAQALRTNGVAKDVSVAEDSAQQTKDRTGVVLLGSGVLEHSIVALQTEQGTRGVLLAGGGTVRDSGIYAGYGITSDGGTIDRATIGAWGVGVAIEHGATTVTSTRIKTSMDGSAGIAAESIDADASVEVDGVTIRGPGPSAKFGTGIDTGNAYAPAARVEFALKNTIIRGYPASLWVSAVGPGHAKLAASYSDYDASTTTVVPGPATVTEDHVSFVGDAGFYDEGDYIPMPGSPLIDAGDPATAQGLDVLGHPLVTDGDGDGLARRDIGAVEAPGVLYVPPAGSTGPAGGGQPAAPPLAPAGDRLAPALSGLRLSHKVFAVGSARTAISARSARGTRLSYALSENAKVVLRIQRIGKKREAGKLTRSAKAGRNSVRFSGRIGAKALKPGRYRAVITATDAAGNRSTAKSLSFRIVKR